MKNDGALSGHPGSTYLLTQKFEFNWTVIGNMDKANDSLIQYMMINASFVHELNLS